MVLQILLIKISDEILFKNVDRFYILLGYNLAIITKENFAKRLGNFRLAVNKLLWYKYAKCFEKEVRDEKGNLYNICFYSCVCCVFKFKPFHSRGDVGSIYTVGVYSLCSSCCLFTLWQVCIIWKQWYQTLVYRNKQLYKNF